MERSTEPPKPKRARTQRITQWYLYPPAKRKAKFGCECQVGQQVLIKPTKKDADGRVVPLRMGTVIAVDIEKKVVEIKVAGGQDEILRLAGNDRQHIMRSFRGADAATHADTAGGDKAKANHDADANGDADASGNVNDKRTANRGPCTDDDDRRMRRADCTVLITPETAPFRQLAYQVRKDDHCLEIGCSTGETSRMLVPLVKTWVGFDTSDQMIATCKALVQQSAASPTNDSAFSSPQTAAQGSGDSPSCANCHWAKIDALIDPKRAESEAMHFGTQTSPTCIFMDIGGNRESIGVLRMITWVLSTFRTTQLLVIKSRALVQIVRESATIDRETGSITDGWAWFKAHKLRRARPKHPLRAPLMLSPKDGKTAICRYYNYHKDGCSKSDCPFDHEHCHACLQTGHVGKQCPELI